MGDRGDARSFAEACAGARPALEACDAILPRLRAAGRSEDDLAGARLQVESVQVRLLLACYHLEAAHRAAAARAGGLEERAHVRAFYVELYGVLDNLLHLANAACGLDVPFEDVRPGRVRARRFWDALDRRNRALAAFLRARTTEALLDERSWLNHLREFRDVAIHGPGQGPRRLFRVRGGVAEAFAARRPRQFVSPEFHEVPIAEQAARFLSRMADLVVEAASLVEAGSPVPDHQEDRPGGGRST